MKSGGTKQAGNAKRSASGTTDVRGRRPPNIPRVLEPWVGDMKRGLVVAVAKHDALIGELAKQKALPMLRLQHRLGYAVVAEGSQWDRVLDQMPRKPYKFLAMVAESERKRAVRAAVAAKRAARRAKYLKAHGRAPSARSE